jgi:hypothetical protein
VPPFQSLSRLSNDALFNFVADCPVNVSSELFINLSCLISSLLVVYSFGRLLNI